MKICLKITALFLLVSTTAVQAQAQQKKSPTCSETDPPVAHVKAVSGGTVIAVARHAELLRVAPPQQLCRNDVIKPSKVSARVVIDGPRQTEIMINERYPYHYDGYAFVVGDDDITGTPGGIDQAKNSTQDGAKPQTQFATYSPRSQPASTVGGRPIIAIYNLDDPAKSGQADSFSRMLESAIVATGKLRIVEREQLGKLVGEQARARAGLITSRTPGQIGGFIGADFLIYGSITNVSLTQRQDLGSALLGGALGGSCEPTVSVDLKITDAKTGEVRYAKQIDQTTKFGTACNGQVDTGLLLRAAADKIANDLITTLYPIKVAGVQADGTIFLNYGAGAVEPGAVMAVFDSGSSLLDPDTGIVIGNVEVRLGLIRVIDVAGRFSKAVPLSSFTTPLPIGAIVRPATPSDLLAAKVRTPQRER